MTPNQLCNNCKHFCAMHTQCRVRAPTPVALGMNQEGMRIMGMWPPVQKDNWCGEWTAEGPRIVS